MAHWHDHQPWAATCIYVNLEAMEQVLAETGGSNWVKGYGNKLDAYLLYSGERGSFGIRYGSEGHEYLSPPISQELAKELFARFGPTPS